MNLQNILKFTSFTHKFQQVVRTIYATGLDRDENDLEHVGQLALVAWYIAESEKLNLDQEKLIKYALSHDLVETYAGDTFHYTKDKAQIDSKIEREEKASKRIKKEFSEFPELLDMMQAYEERKDPEAKFIYALDKLLPPINVYLDNGRSWKRDEISFEMLKLKKEKIAVSKDLLELWKEFVEILEKNKKELFG